jgi:hypothetical protein
VKNYLKKCKDAALGNSSNGHSEGQEQSIVSTKEQDKREGTKVRNSRRRSNSGNREVSSTSWYVAPNLDPTPNFVSVVEVLPPEQTDETLSDNTNSAVRETVSVSVVAEERKVSSAVRSSQIGPGDVLDSRNEGGTAVEFLGLQDGSTPSDCVIEDRVLDDCTSLYAHESTDTVHSAPDTVEVSINTSLLFS